MTLDNYFIVHKSVLPEFFEKVVKARRLIENGTEKDVSSAVKAVGISRSTYYKYKDFILEPSVVGDGRRAVISVMLSHEPGTLSELLHKISEAGGSIITINQSVPIHGKAEVNISLDVTGISGNLDSFVKSINAKLVAIE